MTNSTFTGILHFDIMPLITSQNIISYCRIFANENKHGFILTNHSN